MNKEELFKQIKQIEEKLKPLYKRWKDAKFGGTQYALCLEINPLVEKKEKLLKKLSKIK